MPSSTEQRVERFGGALGPIDGAERNDFGVAVMRNAITVSPIYLNILMNRNGTA